VNVECDLIRAYFEENGFWVRLHEFASETSKIKSHFPFFEIFRSSNSSLVQEERFRLFTGDLVRFDSSVFGLIDWQASGFSPDLLSNDVRLLKFFRKQIDNQKVLWVGENLKILMKEDQLKLIVPALPRSENKTKDLFELLKANGINGVLTMSSVLENLLRNVSGKSESRGNPSMHLLKLLKLYGLATEPQLDIFE
jgi:hypothetical protein